MKHSNCGGRHQLIRLATVLGCVFIAVTAHAQDSFRIGPFGVRSQVSSSANWTDNINNASGGKEDGYWFTVSTDHRASTVLAEKHSFYISTGFGVTHYPERRDLNSVTPVNLTTGLNLNFDKYKYAISDQFSYQSRASDQFFAAGTARVDTYSNTFRASAKADLSPWSFGLSYLHTDTWYGATNGQDQFNPAPSTRDAIYSNADFSFRAWRGLQGSIGAGYNVDWSDGNRTESLVGRVGLRGPLTPKLDLDMLATFAITGKSRYRADLTFRSAITTKIQYSIRAGVLVTQSEVSSKHRVSMILDTQISFAEGVEFPRGVRHTVTISVSPFDLASDEQGVSGYAFVDSVAIGYRMDYTPRIFQRITISPFVRYGQTHSRAPSGIRENTRTFSAGVGAGYPITRKFSLGANYTYTNRQSNLGSAREYESNTVSLSGTYVF